MAGLANHRDCDIEIGNAITPLFAAGELAETGVSIPLST